MYRYLNNNQNTFIFHPSLLKLKLDTIEIDIIQFSPETGEVLSGESGVLGSYVSSLWRVSLSSSSPINPSYMFLNCTACFCCNDNYDDDQNY